jgi:hypothetical protein
MNASASIYVGDEDAVVGEVEVEFPGGNIGIHLRGYDGQIVASAFLSPFNVGVLVGQLSVTQDEVVA